MIDTSILFSRRIRKTEQVKSVSEPIKAQLPKLVEVEVPLLSHLLWNLEKCGVEVVQAVIGDSPSTPSGLESQKPILVPEVANAHHANDDILPGKPQRSALIVIVGPNGQFILKPKHNVQGIAVIQRDPGEDTETYLWHDINCI